MEKVYTGIRWAGREKWSWPFFLLVLSPSLHSGREEEWLLLLRYKKQTRRQRASQSARTHFVNYISMEMRITSVDDECMANGRTDGCFLCLLLQETFKKASSHTVSHHQRYFDSSCQVNFRSFAHFVSFYSFTVAPLHPRILAFLHPYILTSLHLPWHMLSQVKVPSEWVSEWVARGALVLMAELSKCGLNCEIKIKDLSTAMQCQRPELNWVACRIMNASAYGNCGLDGNGEPICQWVRWQRVSCHCDSLWLLVKECGCDCE